MDRAWAEERGVPSCLSEQKGGVNRPMRARQCLRIVASEEDRKGVELDLDAICRDGARKMLRTALRAEVAEYIQAAGGAVDDGGHALAVRNQTARPLHPSSSAPPRTRIHSRSSSSNCCPRSFSGRSVGGPGNGCAESAPWSLQCYRGQLQRRACPC